MGDKQLIKMTFSTLKVLRAFFEAHRESVRAQLAGADVMDRAGISSGTMYPLLYRLEKAGFLEAAWETDNPSVLGRPQRRLYRLTAAGAEYAVRELSAVSPWPPHRRREDDPHRLAHRHGGHSNIGERHQQ